MKIQKWATLIFAIFGLGGSMLTVGILTRDPATILAVSAWIIGLLTGFILGAM